jgi:perosamine synthetase
MRALRMDDGKALRLNLTMSAPDIAPEDVALVNEVLRSPSLSGGPMVERFEADWCARFGVPHAVAVSSGTAGLHLALIAAGVTSGDLVITSPFSFVASANAALYEGAVPVFVDIDPVTLNIDQLAVADALEGAAKPVKVVLPVHVFGRPAAMGTIVAAADRHGALVIEDACEAPGAEYEGRPVGSFGAASVFGFYPNKQITTGEGGLIVTKDAEWARLFRSLRNQGRDDDGTWLRHVRLGYNYRLDEMSAALGVAQLRRFDELLARRAHVAALYASHLRSIEGLTLPPPVPPSTRASWFVYVVRLAADVDRDAVMTALAAVGVPSRPYFSPIHLQPLYRERFGYRGGEFPVTEAIARTTLALPFHGKLSEGEIDYVASCLADAMAGARRHSVPAGVRA